MSDQAWATVIGFGVVVGLRILDYFLPKGYYWRRIKDWSDHDKEERP